MLILALAYSLAQSSFGEAGPVQLIEGRDLASCGEQADQRTILNITWSCLTTIFLCTWVAIHPNIAFKPKKPNMGRFETWLWSPLDDLISYKLPLFLCALLVPEYILSWAIRQYIQAGSIQKEVPGWTRTHGFFMIMGGFHLFRLPSNADAPLTPSEPPEANDVIIPPESYGYQDATPVCPLQASSLSVDLLMIIAPSEEEIKDKSKSDALAKAIVLLQTSWFVIQCVARSIQHLPLTELEIVTLAYAMMNFFIYIFWWNKPRNVDCPIRVYKTSTASEEEDKKAETLDDMWLPSIVQWAGVYILGIQDHYFDLSKASKVPMFWAGRLDVRLLGQASLGPSILGAAFGAVHCIAWWSEFPSYAEQLIWRASCVVMIIVPLLVAIVCYLVIISERIGDLGNVLLTLFLMFPLALSPWLYVAARIATSVIAFATMRSLPPSVFSVVDWTTFIPHI